MSGWEELFAEERAKPYYAELMRFVEGAYTQGTVYPAREKLFAAFEMTPFETVKVVILGQDPYHEPGQAQGLAFYVPEGIKMPPSLRNIAKELGHTPNLLSWAQQGVLLLNATLTVAMGKPMSHKGKGWETFTDAVINKLNVAREQLVFLLWGAHAQKKGAIIDRTRHCVIECAHPSPLSAHRGFLGSNCFGKCNEYLKTHGIGEINF